MNPSANDDSCRKATFILPFRSPYEGTTSFPDEVKFNHLDDEPRSSAGVCGTAASFYFNPELRRVWRQWHGLPRRLPNGDSAKAGAEYPRIRPSAIFEGMTFGLGG